MAADRSIRVLRSAVRVAAFGAAAAFAALWVTDPPGDPYAFPLSAYALTGSRLLWQAAVLLTGLTALFAAFLPFERRGVAKRRSLFAAAAGLLGVAAVPTDPWFPWERMPTFRGAIHVLATAVAMGSFALFALLVAGTDLRWRFRILPSIYAGGLTLVVGTVLVMIAIGRSPQFIGLAEWILLGLALACCAEASRSP